MMRDRVPAESKSREALACPACGMARASWPHEGYVLADQEYCCQGCADGSGCTCFATTADIA